MTENIEQGSAEWFALRVGRVTSSKVADVLAGGKGLTRAAYRNQIVAERLTGLPCGSDFESEPMRRGKEQEPFARAAYEVARSCMVDSVAFIPHPRLMAGASPDGIVGEDGGIEMKNPNTATHIGYLEAGEVPSKYVPQMQWAMACSGRKWWDFVSFDARLPTETRLFIARPERDEEWIKQAEAAVEKFLSEVDEMVEKLTATPQESAPEQPSAQIVDIMGALKASLDARPRS